LNFESQHHVDLGWCWNCGRVWGCENKMNHYECPRCVGDELVRVKAERAALERKIRSLRGALTRAKKR
jgi:predicted RNA-binding Zn-ribbon protein involved in translation (DUF1610 family)